MRFVTFRTPEGTRAGRVEADEVVRLDWPDVGALIASGPGWQRLGQADGPRYARAGLDLAPPVVSPPAIVCVGRNYAAHAAEVRAELGGHPTLFAKFTSSLLGPFDSLVLPRLASDVDWEVELAFVVGGRGRNLDEVHAGDVIGAFTVANDISMRDWQHRTSQFLQGKTFEASTPVGPELVTPDELPRPVEEGLTLTCTVDGVLRQHGTTADMVFAPAAIASYLSRIFTLVPGMLVLSGTPEGVGAARTPPVFLHPGQQIRSEIEGIGTMVNDCVEEEDE